jgi:acetyltransferase-like isoleucine patch superfamily enzyme
MIANLNKLLKWSWSRVYVLILRLKYPAKTLNISDGCLLMPTCRLRPFSRRTPAICVGNNTIIRGELMTFGHGGKIEIGDYCIVGKNSYIWSASKISIGSRVLISHHVNIFDNLTHPLSASDRHDQFKSIITAEHPKKIFLDERDVTIEDDALICAGAFILRGVKVGKGAIVGAGAVVTADVPSWCVVVGNPARVIRMLNPE